MFQPLLARRFRNLAEKRRTAINKYMWDEDEGLFVDYNFRTHRRTGRLTIASVYPLSTKIATPAQAKRVADRIEKDFLQPGGVVTTLLETDQQWDWPNGWAPMQWVTIQGLREYGYYSLADKVKKAWIDACLYTYEHKAKMVEKYNVVEPHKLSSGGEYILQDGFGWTNGVLAALLQEDKKPQ
jgi:alpha,alpha-trehalase